MNRRLVFAAFALLLPLRIIAADAYPEDVRKFVERRDACDHFRGEEPYDEERRRFLERKMKSLCVGTDKKLAQLKGKYRDNRSVLTKLNEYEADIEPQNK